MSFLGAALGAVSSGLQIAGAVSSLTQQNKEEKRARDAAQAQARGTTEAQEFANLLARAQIPGTSQYDQYFIPYLDNIRQQQQAALRLGHREQERERQRQIARGALQTYATGGRHLETRDADRELAMRALDYPGQVLGRQGAVAGLLQQAANTGMGIPGAAAVAGNLQGDVRSQNAAGYGLLGEAARGLIPTVNSFEQILAGQSSGAPRTRLPQFGTGPSFHGVL